MKIADAKKPLLTGLVTLLPVAATVYLLYWFAITAENFLGKFIRILLPAKLYLPGMGLVAGFLLVFVVGILMEGWAAKTVMNKVEQYFYRVPLVKSVYGSIREFLHFISHGKGKGLQQVVTVNVGEADMQLIGFVTRNELASFPGKDMEQRIAVFLPFSYQIGGFTALVPRAAVTPLDVPMEEALRFVLTAGISANGGTLFRGKGPTTKDE